MREYETVLIVQPEISDEGLAGLWQRFDAVLEKHGAARLLYDDLGKRRLAYEIRDFQKGRYVILSFLNDGGVVPELERTARFEDSILRYLTIVVNEDVADIEQRKVEAREEEKVRAQKAAERAAREAEEAAAAEAEERSDDDDDRDDDEEEED